MLPAIIYIDRIDRQNISSVYKLNFIGQHWKPSTVPWPSSFLQVVHCLHEQLNNRYAVWAAASVTLIAAFFSHAFCYARFYRPFKLVVYMW